MIKVINVLLNAKIVVIAYKNIKQSSTDTHSAFYHKSRNSVKIKSFMSYTKRYEFITKCGSRILAHISHTLQYETAKGEKYENVFINRHKHNSLALKRKVSQSFTEIHFSFQLK